MFAHNWVLASADGADGLPAVVASALASARAALGLTALQPFAVQHVFDSHGLVLEGTGPAGQVGAHGGSS